MGLGDVYKRQALACTCARLAEAGRTDRARDPVVVLVLSIAFVFSVVLLHIIGKLVRWFAK